MQHFVEQLDELPVEARASLTQLTPEAYIGNATQQADDLQARLAAMQQ